MKKAEVKVGNILQTTGVAVGLSCVVLLAMKHPIICGVMIVGVVVYLVGKYIS